MTLIPNREPSESPAYNGCTCQCHHVPNIKHIMPCCYPTNIHLPEGGSMPPIVPSPVVVVTEPVVLPSPPVLTNPTTGEVFALNQPAKSDRQLLRELFYASLPTGQRLEEKLIEWEMEDLWREVYARLERS